MLYYETMYIVHPALESGRLKDLVLSIEKSLVSLGGKTCIIEVWGKKKLAYPINKEKYGMYILLQFEADGSKNKEFNLVLEHNTNILSYLTTKIDQNQLLSNIPSLDEQLGLLTPNEANNIPDTNLGTDSSNKENNSEVVEDQPDEQHSTSENINEEEN